MKDGYIRIIVSRGEGYPVLDPRVVKSPTLAVLLHDPQPSSVTGSSYDVKGGGLDNKKRSREVYGVVFDYKGNVDRAATSRRRRSPASRSRAKGGR